MLARSLYMGILLGFVLGCASAAGEREPSSAAPSVDVSFIYTAPLESEAGEAKTLAEHRGRVLLIEIFATWSAPCARTLPVYRNWGNELGPRGLSVVAISVDEYAEDIPAFIARHAPGIAVLWDPGARLAGRLSVEQLPTSLLLDRSGKLILRREGLRSEDEETLRRAIEAALAAGVQAP